MQLTDDSVDFRSHGAHDPHETHDLAATAVAR
jgi:hypothetical protein